MSLLRTPVDETAVIRIVGQGLAGSILALRLLELGYKVRVYDNGYRTSSSAVAAGMWNPLSFVNLKRSWLSHELIPQLEDTYTRFEKLLGCNFYHPMPLLRIFPDAGSANLWDERAGHPEVAPFMGNELPQDTGLHFVHPHGLGWVKGAGWLDLPQFLAASKDFFKASDSFEEREVSTLDMLEWLGKDDFVIQCTGWKPMSDNLWKNVPIHTNKGQVYTLRIEGLTEEYMSNFGKFLIPMGKGLFRAGSTHEHGALDPGISDVANEILEHVKTNVRHPFSTEDHVAGFRPTTVDRLPIVGMHDEHPKLGILNGFGSRGVMLVPYFVEHFITHLNQGSPLMKEVVWQRFEERRRRRS